MSTRTVTGHVRHLDGSDWPGALVTFRLRVDAWTADSAAALQVAGGAGLQYSLASGSTAAPQRFYTTWWRGVAL